MTYIQAFLLLAKTLITTIQYLTKTIDRAVFNARIDNINDAIHMASNGEFGQRLEGNRRVEDNFNRHAPY